MRHFGRQKSKRNRCRFELSRVKLIMRSWTAGKDGLCVPPRTKVQQQSWNVLSWGCVALERPGGGECSSQVVPRRGLPACQGRASSRLAGKSRLEQASLSFLSLLALPIALLLAHARLLQGGSRGSRRRKKRELGSSHQVAGRSGRERDTIATQRSHSYSHSSMYAPAIVHTLQCKVW